VPNCKSVANFLYQELFCIGKTYRIGLGLVDWVHGARSTSPRLFKRAESMWAVHSQIDIRD
jgi:hypothetical protein